MSQYLFIGTFLSNSNGSLSVSEFVASKLKFQIKEIKLVSYYKNKIIRLLDILINILSFKGKIAHIEVYSGYAFMISEFATFLLKIRQKKIILTLHGGRLNEFTKENPNRVKRVLNRANIIMTPSKFLQMAFKENGYNIDYLPNSINLENFPYKRDEIIKNSILWVRAFTEIYNPNLAIKILYEVKKTNPSATLTMIGPDKGMLKQIMKLINELGLNDSIKIVGPVKNELLHKYYQTHEVYLNTTSYESFGVAIVEAASCGIPVVSTSVGEIPYLWKHEESMLIVNSFNEVVFATEIDKLFHDNKLTNKLSKNARQKAETFDWEKIKTLWLNVLHRTYEN